MTEYYQLSTDYELAWNLIQAGEKIIGWMYDEVSRQTEFITASKSDDSSVSFGAFWLSPKMATAVKFIELAQFRSAQFLLPIPDPTADRAIQGMNLALGENRKYIDRQAAAILTLEENLTRSDSDRLAELTSIMRMVQGLEKTPLDKQDGAISLIKRVIYQSICRIDPSQSL